MPTTKEPLPLLLRRVRERNRPYRPPTEVELSGFTRVAQAFMAHLKLGTSPAPSLLRELHALGFHLVGTTLGGDPALALVEEDSQRRGAGVFIYRCGPLGPGRIIQVPHSFYDEGTLPVGVELASRFRTRALFVNTVHRYGGAPAPRHADESQSQGKADLAHQQATYFQRLTELAVETWGPLLVLQVHGFANRADPEHGEALAIVSPGSATAGAAEATRITASLGKLYGADKVLLFGRDTHSLGALTNVQGGFLATRPPNEFIHLEMSRALRDRLGASAAERARFSDAVFDTPAATP